MAKKLFIPGPVDVSDDVAKMMCEPMVGHIFCHNRASSNHSSVTDQMTARTAGTSRRSAITGREIASVPTSTNENFPIGGHPKPTNAACNPMTTKRWIRYTP